MATNAKTGHGTLFRIARPNAPTSFILIAERTAVNGPGLSREILDAFHMDSPDNYKEKVAGPKDGGQVSIEGNLVDGSASQLLLIEHLDDEEAWPFELESSEGALFTGMCLLSSVDFSREAASKKTFSASFEVTGKPTLTGP